MRRNTAEAWLQERIRKHGPVSNMNVFGTPTVFLHGQAASKFIYTRDHTILANQQPSSIRRVLCERNILELSGDEHKRERCSRFVPETRCVEAICWKDGSRNQNGNQDALAWKAADFGSFGVPIIGQSLSLLRALRQNTAETWLMERSKKYGPVSKMNIFGAPTVFIHGQAASKFVYTSSSILSSQRPSSNTRVFGKRNMFELSGNEHKRIRGALVSFLKPDVLKQYVGRMDEEIRSQTRMYWHGKQEIQVMPFMKTVTFNIMSSLITGIEHGSRRESLKELFYRILEGVLSVPINLPFTSFNRSLKARAKIRAITLELIREKRAALEQLQASPEQDLLTCLISLRNEDNSPMLSDEEIVDNAIFTMIAGHDTTSILLTFLIRLLASDASIRAGIVREEEEIAKSKAPGELLTWDDLTRMKYTWSVAMETLRMYPPTIFTFRKVVKDFEYEGFQIPKGWQVMVAGMGHWNDSVFPNASEFNPARFEKQASIPPYSFTSFGGGPRICPGNEFAKIETLVTIHNLVTQFTWKLSSPDMSFSRDPMPSFKNGLEGVHKRLPPGSFGLPIIGQSLSVLRALRQNTAEAWFMERSRKYGPVSKMHIFGAPTVFLHGQAACKFIYTSSALSSQKPSSSRRVFGERNIFELSGNEHKRVRGALVSFLKPDVLKQYVARMDGEIRRQIRMHWHGKQEISVMPFMKTLTFNIMSSFIVGIEQGSRRERLKQLFHRIFEGIFSIPINLPFTSFNRSLKARAKIRAIILELIYEKRAALEQQQASPQQDLLTCLIALQNEDNSPMLSDEEIVDNVILTMVAGYDTTSVLLTFLTRLLASDASIHASIVQEQEEIAKSKAPGEFLTWDDLFRMKYTWSVAMETLRLYPPAFFAFRKVVQDFEYEGFQIPKGWQVATASFATHMNESIFPNASEFDPMRSEKQSSIPPYSFVAFGGGHRICPGNELAKIETLITIYNLVTQFSWELSSPDMSFSRDPFPSFKNGLEILIQPKITAKLS